MINAALRISYSSACRFACIHAGFCKDAAQFTIEKKRKPDAPAYGKIERLKQQLRPAFEPVPFLLSYQFGGDFMSFYALWLLGGLILAGALIALYKQITILKDAWKFQKKFVRLNENTDVRTFGSLWIFTDIVLALFLFGFAGFAQNISSEFETWADKLVFFSIGLFFAAKTVQNWNKGRTVFYPQGIVLQSTEVPFASMEACEKDGHSVFLKTRKGNWTLFPEQARFIEGERSRWKEQRRKKAAGGKSSSPKTSHRKKSI